MENEHRFHKGARISLNVVGVLLIFPLFFLAPIGIWILWRVSRASIRLTSKGVSASSITTVAFDYADVARLGVCSIPIIARGIGGALARYKVGGDEAVNVCVVLKDGTKKKFIASMYEDYQRAMEAISLAVGKPYEPLTVGLWGVKWPETLAA